MTQDASGKPLFRELPISEKLLSILSKSGFVHPTPIQHQVIPAAIEGKDVVGIAQTGTGKTLAFGIPMLQRLATQKNKQGLVILPTRELALQVDEVMKKIGGPAGLRTAVLIGGASMGKQIADLRKRPHVVITTPGRLADHLKQKTYALDAVSIVVLDEADRMLDVGFLPEIKRILKATPRERQTMLFSATMPEEIASIAAAHMLMPLRIEVAPQGTSSQNVEQELFIVRKTDKMRLLQKVLTEHPGSTLVFSRTKYGAKKIARDVRAMGHTAAEIHSNRSLAQRRAALDGFKRGTFRVLVATDIAARGIDVKEISLVINFDLPDNSEDYVHRIGRTGRAGHSGQAISFATPEQRADVKQIERLIRKTLPIIQARELPPAIVSTEPDRAYQHRGGQGSARPYRSGGHGARPYRGGGRGRQGGGGRPSGRSPRQGGFRSRRSSY